MMKARHCWFVVVVVVVAADATVNG